MSDGEAIVGLLPFDPLGGEEGFRRRVELADDFDDTRRWLDPNGHTLSDRVWIAGRSVRDGIDDVLRNGIANGWGAEETSRQLRGYLLDPSRGGYPARRLARTEITRGFGKATVEAAARNPFVEGVRWSLSAGHSEPDACTRNASGGSRGLPRGVYRTGDVPRFPQHPNDLCCLSPWLPPDLDVDSVVADLRERFGLDTRRGETA